MKNYDKLTSEREKPVGGMNAKRIFQKSVKKCII